MTIKPPLLGQLNQGSIFSCARAERYPKCRVDGIVLTARCDLEQDKYNVLNYAPIVSLADWLRVDGYELIVSRIASDLSSRTESALKTIELAVLLGEVPGANVSASLRITSHGEGVFFVGRKLSQESRYLVIDEEQSGLIWRRRRTRDGYDAVLVDETHLFNINELQLFHYFTRLEGPHPIAYSVDKSQAVGDRGWSTEDIANTLADSRGIHADEQSEVVRTVFRSSPDIVNLAFAILSSGATLFTNFDNPMEAAASGFTEVDERLCSEPIYYHVANEQALIAGTFERAEILQRELGCRRSDILIVSLSKALVTELTDYAKGRNKPTLLLTKRGDASAVGAAREAAQWVVGHADFVGGLEFHAAIIVGVDGGRVPPTADNENFSSKSFLSYVSHNRLYVAVSRARYRVELLGEKARGPSRLIASAIENGLLKELDLEV
ncbi:MULTISPECIES: hypothetical protein [unclassified Bradyrhizobium]|uniref:hypothetical protein n=1 Tax=unclassified Bradyrhizobium TaxID=2631580 RepID=UPI003399E1FB